MIRLSQLAHKQYRGTHNDKDCHNGNVLRQMASLVSGISTFVRQKRCINWLFFTDCNIPEEDYPNVRFEPLNLTQLNQLASQKLGIRVRKEAFSQVDLQPAFGVIFEEYIDGFDYWGHCDVDVVWGDIRNFVTEKKLASYDIVSFRKEFLAGHLTLWRNEPKINSLFCSVPGYQDIFASRECFSFDEAVISTFLRSCDEAGNPLASVYWPEGRGCLVPGNHHTSWLVLEIWQTLRRHTS